MKSKYLFDDSIIEKNQIRVSNLLIMCTVSTESLKNIKKLVGIKSYQFLRMIHVFYLVSHSKKKTAINSK